MRAMKFPPFLLLCGVCKGTPSSTHEKTGKTLYEKVGI